MVPRHQDAQEIAQETSLSLWDRREQYDQDRPFLPWAFRFAYFEVLKYRKTQKRDRHYLNDDIIKQLAAKRLDRQSLMDTRKEALESCIQALEDKDKHLLQMRYHSGVTIKKVAEITAIPANTLYKMLERIRNKLMHCISRKVPAAQHNQKENEQ